MTSQAPAMTPAELQHLLREESDRQVLVMITDNSSSIITVKPDGNGVVTARIHKMFLSAPPAVIQAIARWIAGRHRGRDVIQEYIDENADLIRSEETLPRATVLRTAGKCHDLAAIFTYLNDTYLSNRSRAKITWGRRSKRRSTRTIRLGSYDPSANLITINHRLDRSDIPRYMIEYVVFHEMLHEVLGIGTRPDGKRDIHGRTFRFMEQTYPNYHRARAFENKKWG